MEIRFQNKYDFEVVIHGRQAATGYVDFKAIHLVFNDTKCDINEVVNLFKRYTQRQVFVHFE